MNKTLVVLAGVLAFIGLVVNVVFDRDNVYDMFAAADWFLVLVLAFLGAFTGSSKKPAADQSKSQPA
ncbi:MAG: hypothetical protein QW767_00405 [Thermoprotei archaeon]